MSLCIQELMSSITHHGKGSGSFHSPSQDLMYRLHKNEFLTVTIFLSRGREQRVHDPVDFVRTFFIKTNLLLDKNTEAQIDF